MYIHKEFLIFQPHFEKSQLEVMKDRRKVLEKLDVPSVTDRRIKGIQAKVKSSVRKHTFLSGIREINLSVL